SHDRGVVHAGLALLGLEAVRVQDPIFEAERVARPQVRVPLLETIFIQQLANPLACRQVEVVFAFGTDVEAALGLLAKDGGLALGAADPQSLRDTPLWPTLHGHIPIPPSDLRRAADHVITIRPRGGVKSSCAARR